MTRLRVGTRGSELALRQTRWVTERLRAAHPSLDVEEVIIRTHGDTATAQKFDADWPVGGFVGAIEQALAANRIDFAVHSYKDLQTQTTAGLTIAAVPTREVANDVLVTRVPTDLGNLRPGFRIGTSSPRRAAQFRRLGDVEIVAIRGNVGTRIAKLESENLDGVVLAAAGLKRLSIEPPQRIDLPADRFVPSPAQGALAIQTREHDEVANITAVLDDRPSRKAVVAERTFLRTINAGCHIPVGALAKIEGAVISLHGQLFSTDAARMAEAVETGEEPENVGRRLAEKLIQKLGEAK